MWLKEEDSRRAKASKVSNPLLSKEDRRTISQTISRKLPSSEILKMRKDIGYMIYLVHTTSPLNTATKPISGTLLNKTPEATSGQQIDQCHPFTT